MSMQSKYFLRVAMIPVLFSLQACTQIRLSPDYLNKTSMNQYSLSPYHPIIYKFDNESSQSLQDSNKVELIYGQASYYGSEFNGRKTANGEIYDENVLTAAHRTLPFGTFLSVTNTRNNRSVIVRINDRGPFHPKRILDLSKLAAEELDMIHSGITEIEAEILE